LPSAASFNWAETYVRQQVFRTDVKTARSGQEFLDYILLLLPPTIKKKKSSSVKTEID